MTRALGCVLLVGLAATQARAQDAADAAPVVRKVVIAPFTGKAGNDARAIALGLVAGRTDRTDYTVIGHDDAEVVAKRLGVAIESADGRRAISEELGIDAWIDGELDADGDGELRLTDRDGKRIATLPVRADSASEARDLLHEKLWPWVGPRISEQERIVHLLQAERTRALEKVAAREQELARQRQLLLEREQRRMKLLAAAHVLAREKLTAREQEVARQVKIVRDRELAIAREEQRQREEMQRQQAELARQQAEMARQQAEQQRKLEEQERQLALEEQRRAAAEQAALQAAASSRASAPVAASAGEDAAWQPAPTQWPQPQPSQPAPSAWQPPPQGSWAPPAQPAAIAQPGRPRFQPPQGRAGSSRFQPPPPAAASRFQPAPAQELDPAPVVSAEPPMPEGISPETREWLLRKQRERAAGAGGSAAVGD